MDLSGIGRALIFAGVLVALLGVVLTFAGKIPYLGRLPGDIVWKRGNFTFYFPITTMVVLSLVATLVLYIASRLGGKH